MKRIVLFKIVLLVFVLNNFSTNAQRKYTSLESKDGLTFYYKWRRANIFDKNSKLIFVLKVKNSNSYNVSAEFVVDYFWQAKRTSSSDKLIFCIRANRKISGRLKGLGIDTSPYTKEQLFSEDFIIEINGIKIEKVESCSN